MQAMTDKKNAAIVSVINVHILLACCIIYCVSLIYVIIVMYIFD